MSEITFTALSEWNKVRDVLRLGCVDVLAQLRPYASHHRPLPTHNIPQPILPSRQQPSCTSHLRVMASSSNPFQSIQEDDQASPHPKKDSRAGATNFTDEEKVFVAYYVNFTNSYSQLVELLNTQFPVSKHTVRGIASMVTHDTDFTSPSLFNKLYEAAYKESWFTTRAVWGEVRPTRLLATAKWSAEQRAYLAVHDTGKLSKANTLSLTAKFNAQFELGCTNSQIKKACGDINADPDLRDQLRRLATVYVAWYTDDLELEERQEKREDVEKTKKAKARKNLDSKKKGTGLTPEQAEALQSELLA